MALWSGLGEAATAAQLVGVDLGGLISNIIQAAATARQNKKECEQLAGRVSMIDEILSQMQESDETMQKLLTGLENELREAHRLIVSCQERSAAYRFVMAKRQADKLREAQRRIDGYLGLFPMASHNITMRRFDEYYNALNPTGCTTVPCNTYAGARSQRQVQTETHMMVSSFQFYTCTRKKNSRALQRVKSVLFLLLLYGLVKMKFTVGVRWSPIVSS